VDTGLAKTAIRRTTVFEALKRGFNEAKDRLAGLSTLDEKNIKPALREVRLSLLEADVELGVVKDFLARVEEEALGQKVRTRVRSKGQTHRVSAADQFIGICHDTMIDMMGAETEPVIFAPKGKTTRVMMVGLQGAGKTTTCAKLALRFQSEERKPLLVACDMQRPAAVEQLRILGEQIEVPVFNIAGETPVTIAKAAEAHATELGCDVIIYDTAGRLAIDEPLMQELEEIKTRVEPQNVYLVIDAMIGQDAVKTARTFNERLGLTGVILTKLDGDARGGAALSVKQVTGAPIVFAGMGETTDKLDEFRPEGMAGRILGMGDVVGLVNDFQDVVSEEEALDDVNSLLSGNFTLDDFLKQVKTIQKMGSLSDLVDKMPGMSGMLPAGASLDDRELVKIEAMIQSMTRYERRDPECLIREPSRAERVAKGSASPVEAIRELVQKFQMMQQMMGSMMGGGGLLDKIPGMQGLNMARNMRRAMKSGKLPPGMDPSMLGGMPGGMPGMGPGGFPGMPGMGMPGMGMPGAAAGGATPKMKTLSRAEKNARKSQRKQARASRKKNRKK
jgi:signal recognition particle subunit SRP54